MCLLAPIIVCAALTACGPSVKQARENFPQISKQRPLGTKSSTTDSASAKRASAHPYGPSGGWHDNGNTLVDYKRTAQRDTNHLEMNNGCISGFVRFDRPGYLQARSYDDYFGDVYCGWSPDKLQLKPTDQFVFVSLGTCSVGDGGLDQIHEVAWFPENSSEGTLIFSTAHPSTGEKLSAADIYRPSLLGNAYQFNEILATRAAADYFRKGDLKAACAVIDDAQKVLSSMKNAIDGQTHEEIPALQLHRDEWVSMLAYKLGSALGEPEFETTIRELQNILDTPGRGRALTCETIGKMLPLYKWLNEDIKAHGNPKVRPPTIPDASTLESSIVGYEPTYIADYLQSKTPEDEFVSRQGTTGLFWSAVKRYSSHDTKGSRERFNAFLNEKRHLFKYGFEIAAAAKLKSRLSQ